MFQRKTLIAPETSYSQMAAEATDRDSFDLRQLARALTLERKRILGLMAITAVVVYFLVSLATPTYTAEAKLILAPNKARVTMGDEVVANLDPSEPVLNGEIQLLNSNIMLDQVRQALPEAGLVILDPTRRPDSVFGQAAKMLKDLVGLGGDDDLTGQSASGLPRDAKLQDTLLMKAIRDSLRIYSESNSFVITIRADTTDPDLSRILANTVADTYINSQLAVRREAVEQATMWLQERVDALRTDVERAENDVAEFASSNLLRDGGTLENAGQQLARLNSELIDARSARLTAQARLTELAAVVDSRGRMAAASLVNSTTMESLRASELDLNSRDAVWARTFEPGQGKRAEIRTELDEVQAAMEVEVSNEISRLQSLYEIAASSEDNLLKSITEMEDKVSEMTKSGLGLRQLERVADAARSAYDSLLNRLTEAQTQQQMQLPDAKLIARAVTPKIPTTPRPKLFAFFAAVLAGTAAAVAVFFREVTPTTFRSAREVETATGLPVLATVPKLTPDEAGDILNYLKASPYSHYAERIRQLRAALDFSETQSQSVLIASTIPSESKSTLAISLAHMTAKTGLSVIIVDGDLRKPVLAKSLGLKSGPNFVDFM
jgi:uncharacterized protein involved in exopolysaccharide biosynthesis